MMQTSTLLRKSSVAMHSGHFDTVVGLGLVRNVFKARMIWNATRC